jgi:GntR family transcriptional regulator
MEHRLLSSTPSAGNRPVYLRLRDQIAAAIIDGRYREGEVLPSVRQLAADEGANPLTVAKAYQQFQADGLIEVRRGVGMFVVAGAARALREAERRQFLAEEWPPLRERLQRLGIAAEDLLAAR